MLGTVRNVENVEFVRKVRFGGGYVMREIWMWLIRERKRSVY